MTPQTKKTIFDKAANIFEFSVKGAMFGGMMLGILWVFARPYVVTEIDNRMKENNEWIKATYFEPLKKDLNVDEVKKANGELLKELNEVKLQMVELKTEIRMMRK